MAEESKPREDWQEVGPVDELSRRELAQIRVKGTALALSFRDGSFRAISGVCNHTGGPLGEGHLEGDYVVCPWHYWKFHHASGEGEPGFEEDRVPSHETRVEAGRLFVNLVPKTPRHKVPHEPHALARTVRREDGPVRVAGISTTVLDVGRPRFSGSDALLDTAVEYARTSLECETRLIRLRELSFRPCEGFYSKAARACTWPCSITQMDPNDQLDRVYEALVHWADVCLVATPIRWGAASSLYFKMAERMNCIQNQVTTHDRVLIRNKVAAFIVVGGQDNVQAVAGQMLGFFGELGFVFPQFPYVAHSRGWTAEDMEQNVSFIKSSRELHEGAEQLAARAVALAHVLLAGEGTPARISRGGRKAHGMPTS
jgi:nitrite reductase/ring-hydroxylating ferredoxin subunit/multimeric flavodoxin WrbA